MRAADQPGVTRRRVLRIVVSVVLAVSMASQIDSLFHDVWVGVPVRGSFISFAREKDRVILYVESHAWGSTMVPPYEFSHRPPATTGTGDAFIWGDTDAMVVGWGIVGFIARPKPGPPPVGYSDIYAAGVRHYVLTVIAVVLWGVVWWWTRRRSGPSECVACGYDLRGTIAAGLNECPECGALIGGDPESTGGA